MTSFYHIVSGATVTGAVRNLSQQDDAPDGLATILSEVEQNVGFQPWNRDNAGNHAAFLQLVRVLSSPEAYRHARSGQPANPFVLQNTQRAAVQRKTRSWNHLLASLAGELGSFSTQDQQALTRTFCEMARAAASHPNTATSMTQFVKHVVHADSGGLYLILSTAAIKLEYDQHKGSKSWQDTVEIDRYRFLFDRNKWAAIRGQVMTASRVSLDRWLGAQQSPHGRLNHRLNLPY